MNDVDLYLHHEDKYAVVEGKGIYNQMYYNKEYWKEGRGRMVTYLKNIYTTVSWNRRNVL